MTIAQNTTPFGSADHVGLNDKWWVLQYPNLIFQHLPTSLTLTNIPSGGQTEWINNDPDSEANFL